MKGLVVIPIAAAALSGAIAAIIIGVFHKRKH